MGVLVDSNVFISLERSGEGMLDLADQLDTDAIHIAAITAAELLHGVHRADSPMRRHRRSQFVELIIRATRIIPFDLAEARIHAIVSADLKSKGQKIGSYDLEIAATALAHDLTVVTGNVREFERVPELRVRAWPV